MIRGMGVRGAVAVNVITMIGIGPLITIPLVLANLHGSLALVAWIVGAGIALCDGLVWAELGSLYPGSGGTYVYLRETFGSQTLGRMLAFLFTWQIVLSAPLLLASGYIGFAHYAGYLWPPLASNTLWQGIVAAGVGILTLALLYRPIGAIAAISSALAGVAIATLAAVIAASITHFNAAQAFSTDHTASLGAALLAGLGPALVITLYDYYGYAQSCTLGDEVHSPARVLPRSVIISVLGVAALYIALQAGVLGVVRWQELVPAHAGAPPPDAAGFVASTVLERVWGTWPARIGTLAILLTAFASTFGNLLGYSRIPYAAARDGVFLKPFASLHRSGRFPYVALLTIGLLALPACFFSLGDVIAALTAGLVVIQNLAQIAVLFALRARGIVAPYRMRLFPLPALLAAAGWAYIFVSAGTWPIAFGLVTLAAGTIVYLWRARVRAQWPFAQAAAALFVVACALAYARPVAAAWSSSAILERHGFPVFTVSGKPFFVYGAAFFYERLPRDRWRPSMEALRGLGINTLDLYVPWNWHELSDGDFDFSGRTSPRRDLREVIRLAREFDFKIILRPGPVIRNEWRNGGYP
ncbi:MAG TPA: amino acid permease, partial [Candidatus Baltobacteraceae bacterium]|nr:amino acid permease [Candidatus Baltobacteraceae bacterium]